MQNFSYYKKPTTTWEETINSLKRKGESVTFYCKNEQFNAQRSNNKYFVERVKTGQIGETRYIGSSTDLLGIAIYLINSNELTKTFD